MQFLKLNLLLASLTAQPEGLFLLFREKRWSGGNSQLPITSPEWHCSLLHRVFPLPSPAVGPRFAGPFSCSAGVEQARISGAPRGKYQKQLSKCFLHRHHNLKIREIKSLNAERRTRNAKALSGAISDTVFCPSRTQFAGVVAQLQAGVGRDAGSNPPPNLKDALHAYAFLHAAPTPGAKDTGLDPTIPDSAFAIRQTIQVRKFSVCFNAHRHPGPRNLKFYRRSRACELAKKVLRGDGNLARGRSRPPGHW
jgi:hypothetical protein